MPMRLGPGPVFVHESIAATRRWQLYALRALFVLGLLAGLGAVWLVAWIELGKPVGAVDLKAMAQLGQAVYYAIATIQIMLVLVVAPAATAGAICLDRARGNLTHMLATDLGDAEIVLGKLGARLVPILALVATTVPVLALAGLLGGIIIEALLALTLITLAVAVLGCTLALAISVRATKTHEVLMAVYGIECAWILGPIVWEILQSIRLLPRIPDWYLGINPFMLAWAPYAWPTYLSGAWLAGVLGGMTAISAVLTAYAVLRLRAEVTRGAGSGGARRSSRLGRLRSRLTSWRPGPSLDRDPVLWREWRRSRPSKLAKVVWGALVLLSVAGTALGIAEHAKNPGNGSESLALIGGLEVTFGLLLLSLSAPTVLAEERVRGSLDVLLTTPMATERIVLAKWRGAFRVVPALALLPTIGNVILALTLPEVLPSMRRIGETAAPIGVLDRIAYVVLPLGLLLAQAAAVTSVGLAMATWSRRIGRAVAVSVTAYLFLAFGLLILLEVGHEILVATGLVTDRATAEFLVYVVAGACPFGGQLMTFQTAMWPAPESRGALYMGEVIVILALAAFALVVLAMTMASFNRCVGRASDRPRGAPRPPRLKEDRRKRPHGRPARWPSPPAVSGDTSLKSAGSRR